jgi:hypothetical protein
MHRLGVVFLMLTVVAGPFGSANAASLLIDDADQDFHATANDEEIVGHFTYSNPGTTDIHLQRTQCSCGCTTARVDKAVLHPGERGELTAIFTIGNRSGHQEALIRLVPDNAELVMLHMRIDLPRLPKPATTFVSWRHGEAKQTRDIIITAPVGDGYRLFAATSSSPLFSTSLAPQGPGRWTLSLTPTSTDRPSTAMISIQTNTLHQVYVFASIQGEAGPK